MTVGQLIPGAFQVLLVVAVAFAVLTVAASFMRFQILTAQSGDRAEQTEAEDALHLCVIRKLSLIRREVDEFSIIMLGTREYLSESPACPDVEAYRVWFEERLHQVSRKTDSLFRYRDNYMGLVINTGREYARIIAERLYDALAASPYESADGLTVNLSPVVGVTTYPENGARAHTLIQQAFEAMQSAPEGGIHIVDEDKYPARPEALDEEETESSKLVDPLTGVLRSDRVSLTFQKYVARYRKEDNPVSILYLDVDALRRYNEHYGEAAGDALLKGVGQVLRDRLRETDLIGRYGGDEFLVSMPCSANDAGCAAMRLAADIRNHDIVLNHNHLKVTACIGVAGYPEHGVSAGQLFDAADSALQSAKAKGRAVFEIYDESMRSIVHDKRIADVF